MLLSVPIYVEVRREEGRLVHHLRPVFFVGPHAADPHLGLAMGKLHKRLKQHLDLLGGQHRHDNLAVAAFAPDLETHLLKHTLDLRERQARCKLLWVVFAGLDRRIACSPALPDLWLELASGQRLEERTREVLTHHFREQERQSGTAAGQTPELVSLSGQAWVTTVDVDVKTRQPDLKEIEKKLIALFDDTKLDGGLELQRVGRCLDWLYPDELHRAVARDREAEQLDRLLAGRDLRPVVLVGPHSSARRRSYTSAFAAASLAAASPTPPGRMSGCWRLSG